MLNLKELTDISQIAIAQYKLNPNSLNQRDLQLILGDIAHYENAPWRIEPTLEYLKSKGMISA